MNKPAMRLVVFAAGAAALASMAYGQNEMSAKIPFAFRTANAVLPAGVYTFYRLPNTAGTIRIFNSSSNVLASSLPPDYDHPAGNASAVFGCDAEICTLREIRTGAASFVFPDARSRKHAAHTDKLVSIPLNAAPGD